MRSPVDPQDGQTIEVPQVWKYLLERTKGNVKTMGKDKDEQTKVKALTLERTELFKKAGNMVKVDYRGTDNKVCFAIGWFFAMDDDLVRLKVTSTRNETYEAMEIEIDTVTGITDYHID